MEEIKLHQFKEKLELLGYAKRTCQEYVEDVGRFFRYLAEKENLQSVLELKPEHIKAWQAYLTFEKSEQYKRRLASTTVLHRFQTVKTFFRIMHEENLLPYDYASCIVLPKSQRTLPKPIPDVQSMRKLLQAAVPDNPFGIRDRFMLELLYATGIRSEELRTLTLYKMNMQDRTLHITGKGAKDRIVPIGEWVIPYALEYLHAARPWLVRLNTKTDLLFTTRNSRLIGKENLGWIIKMYRDKAGLTMRITPHTLRHACATHMIQEGADIRYVQELLGHDDLNSTQIYTRVTIGDLKKAHLKYHPANKEDFHDEPAA